jgi:acyl carrier protein
MTKDEIREWLNDWLADHLGVSPEDVEEDRSLARYGLEGEEMVSLQRDLEEAIEERIEAGAIRARSTVSSLTQYVWTHLGNEDDDEFDSAPREAVDMEETLRDIGMA